MEYNSFAYANSQSSENLLSTGKSKSSLNNQFSHHILHTDGNIHSSSDGSKNLLKNEEFTLNRKNNDFIEILDNINIKDPTSTNLEANFIILERKLDDKLHAIKQENEKNKILNLNKKYTAYKNIFEEAIKAVYECNNIKSNQLLSKVFNGFNDTVQTLLVNFSKLHEKFTEGETVYQSNLLKKNNKAKTKY